MTIKLKEMFCKKHIVMMAVGIALSFIFFLLGYYLKLPVWLDTSGTILVAVSCGLVPALIVGMVVEIIMSFYLGAVSLMFIFVHFALATVFWFFARRNKHNGILEISGAMLFGIIIKTLICTIIYFILQMQLPNNPYELIVFNGFLHNNLGMKFNIFWCFLFGNLLVSFIDGLGTVVLVVLGYKFMYLPISKLLKVESIKIVDRSSSVEDVDKN